MSHYTEYQTVNS